MLSWERQDAFGGRRAGAEDPPVVAERVIAPPPAAETGRNHRGSRVRPGRAGERTPRNPALSGASEGDGVVTSQAVPFTLQGLFSHVPQTTRSQAHERSLD